MDGFTATDRLRAILPCSSCLGRRKKASGAASSSNPFDEPLDGQDDFDDAMSMHSQFGQPYRKRPGLSRWTLLWSLFAGARRRPQEDADEQDDELNQALMADERDAVPVELPDPHEPPSLLELTSEEAELAAEEERQIRRARRRARRRAKELGLATRGLGEDDDALSLPTSDGSSSAKRSRRSRRAVDEDVFSAQSAQTAATSVYEALSPPPKGYTYDPPAVDATEGEAPLSSHEFLAKLAQSRRPSAAVEPRSTAAEEDVDEDGDTTEWTGPIGENEELSFLRDRESSE